MCVMICDHCYYYVCIVIIISIDIYNTMNHVYGWKNFQL